MSIASLASEFRRYKQLAEGALSQVGDEALFAPREPPGHALVIIVRHLAGNLRSRFTDFLTTDGEKPWRDRDGEFEPCTINRDELLCEWEGGWAALFDALGDLRPDDLARIVTIRGVELPVLEALHRALAHVAYHVGQIVWVARESAGDAWHTLSIPRRGSAAYARNPTREHGPAGPPA